MSFKLDPAKKSSVRTGHLMCYLIALLVFSTPFHSFGNMGMEESNIEVLSLDGDSVSGSLSLLAAPSANLDQARNGGAGNPYSPVQFSNGNAGSSNSHYLESMSVAYRAILTDLAPGTHYLELEYDNKHSGTNAIDFMTYYDRIEPHAQFNHTAEVIDPLIGLTGYSSTPIYYPIPAPIVNKVVACTGLQQPLTAFNALPASERMMTMFNGVSIDSMYYVPNGSGNYGDLNANSSTVRIRIDFTTTNPDVVFAWGGHIASLTDWCPSSSAANISGSPYHTRMGSLDGSSGGQDRSLSAAAVIPVPPCDILGDEDVCANTIVNYSKDPFIGYTYTWSLTNNTSNAFIVGPSTGSSIDVNSGDQAGSYTLQLVMSGTGYTGTCTKVVDVKEINATTVASNFSCDVSAGSINLTVTGGTSPYSYTWSNGATTQDISNLTSGSYTVTVSDALGCSSNSTGSILANPSLTLNLNKTDASCFGETSGSISSLVSGGQSPYSYQWSNGSANPNLNNISSGSYTLTVTDVNGCSATSTTTVSQPSAILNISGSVINEASCFNGTDGSINITVSGGTTPYTYQWSNGENTQDISSLASGSYTVTITDANGCDNVQVFNVGQPSGALVTSINSIQQVSCNGFSDGSIDLNVSGGTPPYSYQWNTGVTTQNIAGLSAGSYSVSISDANGCTTSLSAAITQPSALLNANTNITSQVSCFGGSNGSITVTTTGGTSPYSYLWSTGSGIQSISGLASGTYTVTATDINGCIDIKSATITQPSAALTVSVSSSSNVSCHGGSDGSISLAVTGGTAPYTFSWNNGSITQDLNSLSPGTYSVIVSDINGCTATTSAIITHPQFPLSATTSVTSNISCFSGNNGAIDLSVNGGTSPYSYLWSNGEITEDINGLPAGNYNVTITDANGCSTTTNATIVQPAGALSTNVNISQHVSCFGGADGAIDLTVTGGTLPYTFNWNTGASSEDLSGLSVGTYTVTITDANGCNATQTAAITQPSAVLTASATATQNVSCFGGSDGVVALTVNGGTTPYTYLWNTGATTSSIVNISSGTYSVTVTDANGCIATSSANISQPSAELSSSINSISQVSCYGFSDASIDINVSGGTSPYSYLWNNGSTSQDMNGLSIGNYSVVITDANGCTTSESITISQPSAVLNISVASTQNISCFGGSDGSIDLIITGGTAPYSYVWSNGASSQDLNNLGTGTYTVTVTDANGCIETASINLSQPAASLNVSGIADPDVYCYGEATGSIQLTVTGGTMPYAFLWNNGATTEDLFNLSAGTYTVTVTDINGCTNSISVNVNQPAAPLSASVGSQTNIACFGDLSGSIDLNVSGGTAPYVYNWSNGANTQDLSGVGVGTYSVNITDANGCNTSLTVNLSQPTAELNANILSSSAVSCFGGNDGSIDLSVSGGTAPYTYSWSNGATTQNLNGLSSGTYTVIITDANGCTYSLSSTITQPIAELSIALTSSSAVLCHGGSTGSINVTVSGGTQPYTYSWSNGSNSQDINGLSAGTYTILVTDANGCTSTLSHAISQPSASLSSTTSVTSNISCFSGNNGAIDLTVSGGTAPYFFSWSNGSTTEDINGLAAGTYTVDITDANGCTVTTVATITQPAGALSISLSVSQNVSCNGGADGAIDLSVIGGTAPYTYSWSNGSNTEDVSGLTAGTYTVTVTDVNGCNSTQSATITQPSQALSVVSFGVQQVLCHGGNSAFIDVFVNGGTSPYTYQWSNGSNSEDLNNLGVGTYTLTVTDANGCTSTLTESITQPSMALNANISSTSAVNCFGGSDGSIDLTVVGGTAPYSFNWSNGDVTEDISSLSAGTYTVTVTDANGCTHETNAAITQPLASLSSTISVSQNVSCFNGEDGTISLSVTGGTFPYSYLWSNGQTTQNLDSLNVGTYTVTITDVNGCVLVNSATVTQPNAELSASISSNQPVLCYGNQTGSLSITVIGGTAPYTFLWSSGATTQNITSLYSGVYSVSITDANGCQFNLSGTITQPAAPLSVSANSIQEVSCFGGINGVASATPSGGSSPYNYQWSNGENTQTISGLTTGTYTVTITDVNGCSASSSILIVQPSASLTVSVSMQQAVNCFAGNDGSAAAQPSGGTSPYSYLWNNGAITSAINNLTSGTYSVTVTDSQGCITSGSVTITQPQAALTVQASIDQDVSCYGGNDGSISIVVQGGTPAYNYMWNTGSTLQNITGLAVGSYTVTVTDINGCSSTVSASVGQPVAALSASTVVTSNISCFSGNNGSINLTVSGGSAPYSFVWSTGATTEDISGVAAGNYSVTITDVNGCTTTASGQITQPVGALNASVSMTQFVSCFGGSNGSLNVSINGGTAPFTYLWSNGSISQSISNLSAGVYTVTVTDANGCFLSQSGAVTQPSASLSINVTSVSAVLCHSGSSGTIDLTVSGGTSPYSFSWSNGATTEDLTGLTAGTYTVIVTDVNGCSESSTINVSQPQAALGAVASSISSVSCYGGNNGSASVVVSGGTVPYTYLWNNGEVTPNIFNLSAGIYNVIVTDANGCTQLATTTVGQPSAPLSDSLYISQNVGCFGDETGALTLQVSGGTQPYTFIWSNGAITQNIDSLLAGTFMVTVTDANGCIITDQITVQQPLAPLLAMATVTQNVFCNGGNTGSIDLTTNGGTTPYTYLWSNGSTLEDISGLAVGTYTVTVTDANGCTATASAGIGQPAQQLTANLSVVQDVLCFNGTNGFIDINVTGGTMPYTYIWNTGSTTQDIGGLVTGTYTVTVTDINGCDTTLTAQVNQPQAPLIPTLNIIQHVSCFGGDDGQIGLGVTGGTPPYLYVWSTGDTTQNLLNIPAGSYSVTVTDANGCNAIISDLVVEPPLLTGSFNMSPVLCHGDSTGSLTFNATGGTPAYSYLWSTGGTSSSISGLVAGLYSITVTDANGCIHTDSMMVTEPTAPLSMSGVPYESDCLAGITGGVDLTPAGGTPGYSYQWSNGDVTQNLGGVMAGTFTVTVTDANGCTETMTFEVGNNSTLNVNASTPEICIGQMATLTADSIPNGQYQWYYNGAPLIGANGHTFTTPAGGYYYVTITTWCGSFTSDSLQLTTHSLSNVSISNNQIICPPESVTLNATGGTSYAWSPATNISFTNVPNPTVNPTQNTTYSVVITNQYGCSTTLSVDVNVMCDSLLIPTGFSPNDDGVNDGYVIDGIGNYPGNKIWVYNRWGNLVFKTENYQNYWDGVCNVSGVYFGEKLPSGTYFYILDLNDGNKPKSGYLIIRR